ncbi:hypothetical protein ACIG0C_05475 [Kitasatospora aureofaciens]|uniref:Uncharacterized protein n=1 Tax=Kitasatospora aureofaciens TaxID=1894 RepID=A0A1E7N3J3_KITAU|nr:hypothetical protein [Kitasatospora aureofaciens]OEV35023.1 hypothetical protein HS99_0034380 [Kitasatospora aureofaciens]GGU69395.1 hypothetical protein GCM10010502_20670 [Kitasatospora aureofaciens]
MANHCDGPEATRLGAGIGVLPAFLTGRAGLRRLLADEVDIRLPITLAVRREAVTHPAVRAVRDTLHREVAERRAELLPGAAGRTPAGRTGTVEPAPLIMHRTRPVRTPRRIRT